MQSGSFLSLSPSFLTEFMTLSHLKGVDEKCLIEINPYLVNIL